MIRTVKATLRRNGVPVEADVIVEVAGPRGNESVIDVTASDDAGNDLELDDHEREEVADLIREQLHAERSEGRSE